MLRVRGKNKPAGGTFPRFSVSTFNVILRRYSLLEVPRRRIHNTIAKAMTICVAVGNKVMDTRLPQPAGCGDKYDVSGFGWGRGFSAFCTFFKYPSPDAKASPSPSRGEGFGLPRHWCDKILGTDCASRPRMTGARNANSFGRSMIEMLGVLAIIGVLSVGGIAGYSKAMEKFKINKATEEYNYMVYGLIEHLDDLRRIKLTNDWIPLADYVSDLNLVPESWEKVQFPALTSGLALSGFRDTYNNYVFLLLHPDGNIVQIETRVGGQSSTDDGQISESFSKEFCINWFSNVAQPLSSVLKSASLGKKSATLEFFGAAYCPAGSKCLKDLAVSDISQLCASCDKKNEWCEVIMRL